MNSPLTCAGAQAGVIARQPLLLEHPLQVDPLRSVLLSSALLLLRLAPTPPTTAAAPLARLILLPVGRRRQRLLHLLLPLCAAPAGRHRWPIDAQRVEEGCDVTSLGEHGAVGHSEPGEAEARELGCHIDTLIPDL